jgi:AcrR family transcriptional regulator
MTTFTTKRLTSDKRRAAMLEAAAAVFFEQGYAATSIDAIIERLGGSKRNIYNEFGSKEGLFLALVSEITDRALSALESGELDKRDLRKTLLEFGRRLTQIYTSPALLGVYRTIVTEAHRFPELARAFYEKGPGRAASRLFEVLEEARANGEVQVEDCATAADQFVGMLRDNLHLRILLGLQPVPAADAIEAIVVSAVDIFLNGVQRGRR